MARGRILSKAICVDKRVNDLSSFESMLAFTWLISHLDVKGRTFGDPAIVRSMVFPRRSDVSVEQMESYIREWHESGLVIWYRSNNDLFLQYPGFDKNQPGLNADREAPSIIPDPEELMSNSGVDQEQFPIKFKLKLKSNINLITTTGETDNPPVPVNNLPDIEDDKSFVQFRKVWEEEGKSTVANGVEFAVMVSEFEKAGVTPEIYRTAIQEQKLSTYKVKGPTSVKNWAIGIADALKKPQKQYQGKQAESVSDQNARVAQEVMAEMAKGKL